MDALRILATNSSSQASTRTLSLSSVGIMTAFSLVSIVFNKLSMLFNRLPLFMGTRVNISTVDPFFWTNLFGILTNVSRFALPIKFDISNNYVVSICSICILLSFRFVGVQSSVIIGQQNCKFCSKDLSLSHYLDYCRPV